MAQKEPIQYVRYYAYGTAAHAIQQEQPRRKPRPAPKPQAQRIAIPIDPVAVVGTAVAVAMLLCVIVGFVQVNQTNRALTETQNAISELRSEGYVLERKYENGYDLEEVRIAAEAMGLVPKDQVRHITVSIPEPVVEQPLPWWQKLWNDFLFLFE